MATPKKSNSKTARPSKTEVTALEAPTALVTTPQSAYFTGAYVSDICDVLVASALARLHCVILGAPGWGKTAIELKVAARLAPFSFTRLDPSTPPEKVTGAYNPAELLNGKLVKVVDGTPYDPSCRISILDEIFRANDVVFDSLLDTLDRQGCADPSVVWANANFVAQGERTDALIDRIALWQWLAPSTLDSDTIVSSHLNGDDLDVDYALPTWQEIEDVRAMKAGPHAIQAVQDCLRALVEEATQNGLHPHPRRLTQWTKLVYRVAAYHRGAADFTQLPKQATSILRFAYPALTADDAANWQRITAGIGDPVGAAIETIKKNALTKFQTISGISDAGQRMQKVGELGKFVSDTKDALARLSTTDPRVNETTQTIMKWFSSAMIGDTPDSDSGD